jgi:hypothetical protein
MTLCDDVTTHCAVIFLWLYELFVLLSIRGSINYMISHL